MTYVFRVALQSQECRSNPLTDPHVKCPTLLRRACRPVMSGDVAPHGAPRGHGKSPRGTPPARPSAFTEVSRPRVHDAQDSRATCTTATCNARTLTPNSCPRTLCNRSEPVTALTQHRHQHPAAAHAARPLFLGFPIVALRTLEYTNIVVTQFELRFQ